MKAVGKLEHPHIVRAMDAGEVDGLHYLSMEYVDGVDLHRLVQTQGKRSVLEACDLMRQTAEGLAHAHQHGMVHRDIKPGNLLLSSQGVVKILDLGLARLQGEGGAKGSDGLTLTGAGMCMGTPDYMAPEQWEDTHAVDERADLYALGCTLYYLLAGKPPYDEPERNSVVGKMTRHVTHAIPDLRGQRADVPNELNSLCRRLLSKHPQQRPQTATEVVQALESIMRGLQGTRMGGPGCADTLQASPAWSAARAVTHRHALTAMGGLAVLILLAAIAFAIAIREPARALTPAIESSNIGGGTQLQSSVASAATLAQEASLPFDANREAAQRLQRLGATLNVFVDSPTTGKERRITPNDPLPEPSFFIYRIQAPAKAFSTEIAGLASQLTEFWNLSLTGEGVDASILNAIAQCPRIRTLSISSVELPSLTPLQNLPALSALFLNHEASRPAGDLSGFRRLRLLGVTGGDDGDLESLSDCIQLRTIAFEGGGRDRGGGRETS